MTSELPEAITIVFHNMPPSLLREFAVNVVKPYFGGNFNEAIRQLMEKAVIEEALLQSHLDKRRVLG